MNMYVAHQLYASSYLTVRNTSSLYESMLFCLVKLLFLEWLNAVLLGTQGYESEN